eukprot:CAMPEP_0194317110 /NCGR_PEP_ID=MMETSP0171-20130528/13863_1 /TAXON_ID=218684 /ORGANISM="Corethron pennatum, Strain L29A3" /LENGTH=81 /DNA_ID=CAMNT_0039073585 /DNA_START=41 /DNA_END=283 /DNA_ORIENTATION=-
MLWSTAILYLNEVMLKTQCVSDSNSTTTDHTTLPSRSKRIAGSAAPAEGTVTAAPASERVGRPLSAAAPCPAVAPAAPAAP